MEKTNLVIIGSGPAGYTAAIYAARAGIQTTLFEGFRSGIVGGQLMTTTTIENYPGFPYGIMGPQLMDDMKKQVLKFKTKIISDDVIDIDIKNPFVVIGNKQKILTDAVIIATGANARRLDVEGAGDNQLWQKGVSACAVCDGAVPIFRDKNLFVIGGGDSAVEEALFLTKFGSKVYIVHRRDSFRASDVMQKRALENKKIEILWNMEVQKIVGDKIVEKIIIKNNKNNKETTMDCGGVFFAIGRNPNSKFIKGKVDMDSTGYIITKGKTSFTNIDGIFACGDVQDPIYRQAVCAAGTGCLAALDAQKWLIAKGYLS